MTRRDTKSWLYGLVMGWLTIVERKPCIEWVPEHIVLPREVSQVKPGKFDLDVFPLSTIVYHWFDDPRWRELIIVKGSQGGISQAAQNVTCYIGDYQLGDVMWTLESDKKVVELNNERLKPMITRACESLKRHLYEAEDRKLKNRTLLLKGLKIIMAGARRASGVASRSIPFHFGDEVGEWPSELEGKESNALTLLRERAKLISWAKLLFFSKPRSINDETTEDLKLRNRKKPDDDIIWNEYLSGTRHKCHIPCPSCQHEHEIVWENVRFQHCRTEDGRAWDYARMERETYLLCPNCQYHISEDEKVEQILKQRKWVQTNFHGDENEKGERVNLPIPGKMSAHMSDLYANTREFPDLSLGKLAIKWCSAKSTSDRRAFRRGVLGLPVENKRFEKLDITNILALSGQYERGTVPTRPAWTYLEVDVQGHGKLYKWLKIAFKLDDTAYVIDHGETESDEEIEFIMDKPIPINDEPGQFTKCQTGWVDEGDGFTSNQVLNLCVRKKLYRRLCPVKGRGGSQTEKMTDRVTLQDNRTHKAVSIERYLLDSDYFLDELYEQRIALREQIDEALRKGNPPSAGRLWFFEGPSRDFCQEFCTERKDFFIKAGKQVFGWLPKPTGGKNDNSDLVKYGLGSWYRTKPKILEAIERQKREAARAAAAEEAAKAGKR